MRLDSLTTFAKVCILLLIVGVFGGIFFAVKDMPFMKNVTKGKVAKDVEATGSVDSVVSKDGVIRLSLDEWIGWKSVLDANGGLETKSGSIFDKLGIKVSISIINDGSQSSAALIANKLDGAGYTINRYAFLYDKFLKAKVPVKMPFITNFSTGGDGIIAKTDIKSVEDLIGKKIGVPRFSEAQTLIEWLLGNSSLTEKQVTEIRKNMIMFDTPDDAAKAFFAGQVDAAATWQPYLSQAQETNGARLLFSTKSATNLILDGIVFREDFLQANNETVTKFIEGVLQAQDMYTTEFVAIKDSMPLFASETDENIKAMSGDATLADYLTNESLLKGTAQKLFKDMSTIWSILGEAGHGDEYLTAFDNSYLTPLKDKFTEKKTEVVKFTEADRTKAKAESNDDALLTKRLSINFETGASTIKASSHGELNAFAETAALLNGVVMQIEGNTDNVGDKVANQKLSEMRAKAVMQYLKYQGVDPTRMVVIGNGDSNPIASNDTTDGKASNRRTDMFFKVVK